MGQSASSTTSCSVATINGLLAACLLDPKVGREHILSFRIQSIHPPRAGLDRLNSRYDLKNTRVQFLCALFVRPSAHQGRTGLDTGVAVCLSVCVSCPSVCLSDMRMYVCVCVFLCVSCSSVRPPIWAGPNRIGFVVCLFVCNVRPSVSLICVCHVMCVMFVRPSAHLGRTGLDCFFGLSDCCVCVLCAMTIFCCASIFILCAYAISSSVRPIICSVAGFDGHGGQTKHHCHLQWI